MNGVYQPVEAIWLQPYDIKPVDPRWLRQRVQAPRFTEALRQADGRELEPLAEYLSAYLPAEHADRFMTFLRRGLRKDRKAAEDPARVAAREVVALAQKLLDHTRKTTGRQIGRRGHQRAIARALTLLVIDEEIEPGLLGNAAGAACVEISDGAGNTWHIEADHYAFIEASWPAGATSARKLPESTDCLFTVIVRKLRTSIAMHCHRRKLRTSIAIRLLPFWLAIAFQI